MPKIINIMRACSLGAFMDASWQDPAYLSGCQPKDLPLLLERRMSSAIASWHGYINALYRGHGTYKMYGGSTYSGAIRMGFPHGQGIKIGTNGDRYEGQWEIGKRHGQGTLLWADGDRYEGQWESGNRQGQGTILWASGSRYEGEWKTGQPHGQGIKIWPSGSRHEGQWEGGEAHGQGIRIWADGDRYEGQWAKNWPGDFAKNSNLFVFEDFESPPIHKELDLQAIILQSTSDHNGAFGIKRDDCNRLANALTIGGYKSRVIYFSSPQELQTALGVLGEKIDLAWIRAHGSGKKIDCGSSLGDEKILSPLTPLLKESCSVVFESCQTGRPKMLAEKYFQILCQAGKSPTVIAPNGLPAFRGIDLDALKNGTLKVLMLSTRGTLRDIATTYSKK